MKIFQEIDAFIITNKNSETIFKITNDGEIFYKSNCEMNRVNCPKDIEEAFCIAIFNYTGKQPDEIIINNYIQKILNHEYSNKYVTKLESAFRKLKLEKLNK